nr:reverse transcriptase domain-containing protein [Tanacetum cinerariifolium]
MVCKGAVSKPPSDDEGSERPRKMPKKSDKDEGPSDPRGPLIGAGGSGEASSSGGAGREMDIDGYTNRFHELALLCPRMVELEAVKVEQYIRGLTKSIRGDVTSSQPATINDVVRLAYQLAGQLIQDKADETIEGEKRKGESDRGGRGDNQREHNRRQNQRRGNAGAMKNAAPNNNETC